MALDRNRPFGIIYGDRYGRRYEQDGAYFDSRGIPVREEDFVGPEPQWEGQPPAPTLPRGVAPPSRRKSAAALTSTGARTLLLLLKIGGRRPINGVERLRIIGKVESIIGLHAQVEAAFREFTPKSPGGGRPRQDALFVTVGRLREVFDAEYRGRRDVRTFKQHPPQDLAERRFVAQALHFGLIDCKETEFPRYFRDPRSIPRYRRPATLDALAKNRFKELRRKLGNDAPLLDQWLYGERSRMAEWKLPPSVHSYRRLVARGYLHSDKWWRVRDDGGKKTR